MEITLFINGKERTFTAPFVSTRMFRRTLEVSERFKGGALKPEDVDFVADYIVDLFGEQFTRDDLYDGLEAAKFIPTIRECVNQVMGGFAKATVELVGDEKNE